MAYRVGARLFDYLVLLVPQLFLLLVYLDLSDPDAIADPLAQLPIAARIGFVVGPVVYEFAFLLAVGATPGKLLAGTRVVRFADGGRPAPYQLGLRLIAGNLAALLGVGGLTSGLLDVMSLLQPMVFFAAAFHPMLRGLHDLAAGTIVVRTR